MLPSSSSAGMTATTVIRAAQRYVARAPGRGGIVARALEVAWLVAVVRDRKLIEREADFGASRARLRGDRRRAPRDRGEHARIGLRQRDQPVAAVRARSHARATRF